MTERFSWAAEGVRLRDLMYRFSNRDVVGGDAFRRQMEAILQSEGEIGFQDDFFAPLWSEAEAHLLSRRRPRLFISHKQQDSAKARDAAETAEASGFDTWLDVLDPKIGDMPTGSDEQIEAAVVASLIEMALLNCTHVLVVHTTATRHSRWVPYEYGRVKDNRVFSNQAAARLHDNSPPPEYMYLGPMFRTESALSSWLRTESTGWQPGHGRAYPS